MTPSPWLIVVLTARLCSLARRGDYDAASKIALINTLKRRFIGDGEWSIDAVPVSRARNLRFMLSCAFGAAASKNIGRDAAILCNGRRADTLFSTGGKRFSPDQSKEGMSKKG
jgi:hypothetical protein